MLKLADLAKNQELFSHGHRACAGCGEALAVRQIMLAAQTAGMPVVTTMATGCLEIFSSIYPHSAWQVPMIHTAFETAASTAAGVEAAYRFLRKTGRINEDIAIIAFAGDGGTYDIGLQALSGALERRHRFLYVCTNNEAYMNTGIQRSSATPYGADTTTSPAGKILPGKVQHRKNIMEIVIGHEVPYAAQTTVFFWRDLVQKVQKALLTPGPTFLNVLVPCPLGWRHQPGETVKLSKLAADTCYWPIYEYENGSYKINYEPSKKLPVEEFLKPQGRFRHLFEHPEGAKVIAEIQRYVDEQWTILHKRQECFKQ
ncbi:MAG: pyruvate ferredoxin oxidoreductase [candidate division WOR-3 bacterium]|jgi:pyruvate ferredoxin oxidoreductase beta subunit|nr:pyruvate ferredoxin oxidoreductase [candidate division WOR-3 bacterium]MCR4423654.1 thiamine pyrophosphate-dependent enzyme [candidate division WOR-3 bacterium]MDH7518993.1 thiamine pyrophosphate-dependent enzyme [bacterium]